ncbi:hypothetical protein D3C74_357070 [compost metagenome]
MQGMPNVQGMSNVQGMPNMQAPVQEHMPSTCCGGYHPYVDAQSMYPQQVAGVYTGYPDGYGLAGFQVQPNVPGASLGGFGGAGGVKGFFERDSQFTGNANDATIQATSNEDAEIEAEVNSKSKAKTKTKKEVKVSGSPSIKNTTKRARGNSGSISNKKRVTTEAAKGRNAGRRSLWINE